MAAFLFFLVPGVKGTSWARGIGAVEWNVVSNWTRSMADLPLSGQIHTAGKLGWPGYHWPALKGGLNFSVGSEPSPAAKWDSLGWSPGGFSLQAEQIRISSRNCESWNGICDGFSGASLLFFEPKPVSLRGQNGESVFFSSMDIKALASWFLWKETSRQVVVHWMLGRACKAEFPEQLNAGDRIDDACDDPNPGLFHLAIGNEIGLHQRGIAMDLDSGAEIWNIPVKGYESRVLGDYRVDYPGASPEAKRRLLVETVILHPSYVGPELADPILGTGEEFLNSRTYRYVLELNGKGEVIGGEWLTREHPDFLWSPKMPAFEGELKDLHRLLEISGAVSSGP
jgi:hypothetical protein